MFDNTTTIQSIFANLTLELVEGLQKSGVIMLNGLILIVGIPIVVLWITYKACYIKRHQWRCGGTHTVRNARASLVLSLQCPLNSRTKTVRWSERGRWQWVRPLIDEEVWTDTISYSWRDMDTRSPFRIKRGETNSSEKWTRFTALHSSSLET